MSTADLSAAIAAAAREVASSSYVVAMTGAGISVESGIPPFRGPGGLWTKHGEPSHEGYTRFLENPSAWWRREMERAVEPWVAELRQSVRNARPNPGHTALAGMESAGYVRSIITQNIDGLHTDAGTSNIVEIHGSRRYLRCVECGDRTPRSSLFATEVAPPCRVCGGPVKYDSVLFGEPIPPRVLEAARRETDRADCVIVVGSSSTVRPAGGLPRIARANGATLIEINISETRLSADCDVVIRASASAALPALLAAVRG
ncbi:MAG: Sir2 family NAD-dependent protein deacetylase [Chloroflexi bacterium]|nr:Sir2 family NAD-dependent protein deacetylase [Chloroflexota bacterium]